MNRAITPIRAFRLAFCTSSLILIACLAYNCAKSHECKTEKTSGGSATMYPKTSVQSAPTLEPLHQEKLREMIAQTKKPETKSLGERLESEQLRYQEMKASWQSANELYASRFIAGAKDSELYSVREYMHTLDSDLQKTSQNIMQLSRDFTSQYIDEKMAAIKM